MLRASAIAGLTLLVLLDSTNTAVAAPRLLVATVDDTGGACGPNSKRVQHLLSYSFSDGQLSAPDTILSNPGSQLRFNCESSRIHQNRYVITDLGDVVDLQLGEFVHCGGRGSAYTKLISIEGDQIILHAPQSSEYFAFSLSQRAHRPFEPSGKDLLPGVISPDGTMSVHMAGPIGSPHELWLHRLDGEKTLLGTGFHLELSLLSSAAGIPVPRMWLDNRRILTQRSNGEIVMVGIDGSVEALVDIELPGARESAKPPSIMNTGASGASFLRDADDNIVYSIGLMGSDARLGPRAFVLDVANKTYREPAVVWLPVGSDFDLALSADSNGLHAIRHEGEEIGRERCQRVYCRTTDGRIALVTPARALRVWTKETGQWSQISYQSPAWITHSAVVGWYEPRASH